MSVGTNRDSTSAKRPLVASLNRSGPNPTNIKRKPKVSIVIPTLSENERIAETLYGLFRQSIFKDSEVIIVEYNPYNDPYIRDLAHGMAHVRHITVNRSGIAFARHAGIMSAYSDIICNFDADCEWLDKYCLERMTKPIMDKECVLTVCDNMFDLVEVPPNELQSMEMPTKICNFLNNIQRTTPLAILEPGSCLDKKAYEYVGGYDDVKQYELFHLGNRLAYHFNSIQTLLFSRQPTGVHKIHVADAAVIVSSRRAVKWSQRGLEVLDYQNAYR